VIAGGVVTYSYSEVEARQDILRAYAEHEATIQAFHELSYHQRHTWGITRFEGINVLKNASDLWTYHEWIHLLKPNLIIETGTAKGGSALYFARQMEAWGGKVLTFDIERHENLPHHEAIRYVKGDTSNDEVVRWAVAKYPNHKVMVVLDSNHETDHVLSELEIFAPLVSVGQLLVIEDTNVEGPRNALRAWLPQHPEFLPEPLCERWLLTSNPGGWLRRVK